MDNYAIYETQFGNFRIDYEEHYIFGVKKVMNGVGSEEQTGLMDGTSVGVRTSLTDKVYEQLQEYFAGNRQAFEFPYVMRGTQFQQSVWHALEEIPYGETRSYKEIAIAIGNPKASRAVGMANNKNPCAIIVPCHRVIGSGGKLVGYAYGLDMKQQLIKLEQQNRK